MLFTWLTPKRLAILIWTDWQCAKTMDSDLFQDVNDFFGRGHNWMLKR